MKQWISSTLIEAAFRSPGAEIAAAMEMTA
jgi:hypothetical protein